VHTAENSKQTKVFARYNVENPLCILFMQTASCLHDLLSSFSMFMTYYPFCKTVTDEYSFTAFTKYLLNLRTAFDCIFFTFSEHYKENS